VLNSIVETNPYEIILINNSPRDALNKALDKISNALVLEPGKNIGAAAAWNLGFKASTGDYVLFSADDIVLHPEAVQKAVSLISKDSPFVYGDYGIVRYENGKFETVWEYKSRPFSREVLLEGIYSGYVSNYIDGASPMRRDVFPGFDTALSRFIDWEMISRIVKARHAGLYLPGRMFDTIDHPQRGITRDDNPPLKALRRIRTKWNIHPTLSEDQHHEIELGKRLLKLYQERIDLRRLFPEVAVGDLQHLLKWAERLSRRHEHEAYDLAYFQLRPYTSLLKHWRDRSTKFAPVRLGGPLGRLLALYERRSDLQSAMPEVRNGKYSRLLQWAEWYLATGIDAASADFVDCATWYRENEWSNFEASRSKLESELSSKKKDLDARTRELQDVRNELQQQVQHLQTEIERLREALEMTQATVSQMEKSPGWRVVTKYRELADRYLPFGTKRRRLWEWMFRKIAQPTQGSKTDYASHAQLQ